ncbi:PilT/PilU family type 4a pilus ATPase [Wenzhouxiangella sp. AB-CW3]|uniref:PilT/PilU family type 4a pilus ATPase n=1 Tax=Wenzhouxiangella sp. AB-CW3 TaxID=2771012 RepID=UPI00168AF571|nr:PilT/PilU family type 4a pilus ATPase [Wenzhouxiangella sp. AB-CW3]QOC22417.1 PilT/PilU family type 4a pilus ATPase [Wenzhouxiangella sp. AB-CW3]
MNTVQDWLHKLHETKGSDLFVTVGAPPCIKVHGRIKPLTREALTHDAVADIIDSVMTADQRKEFHETHECQFAVSLEGVARFRVSAFYQRNSVGMVCRRIETKIPSFDELDLPESLSELAMVKRGIVILVGATGTGKSTTLAAMVGHRNVNASGHIISIEDPIEFVHKHRKSLVTQREVGIDTESFEVALKNTLRQAPDVILIGEIRTREAMEHAITFAETGHLCLTTLHANNANQAMDRILHFFPEERHPQVLLDLSFNLRGVVAQQLVPSIDGSRRHVALEVLLNTPLVQEKIRKGAIEELKSIMKDSGHHGMVTFDQSLLRLYQEGLISYEEALRHADSSNEVRLAVKLSEGGDAESLSGNLQNLDLVDDSR